MELPLKSRPLWGRCPRLTKATKYLLLLSFCGVLVGLVADRGGIKVARVIQVKVPQVAAEEYFLAPLETY